MTEIILPSGRFARVRPMLAIDLLLAGKAEFLEAALVARMVTIDDEPISYQDALVMDIEEFMPILAELSKRLPQSRKDTK